MNFVYVPAQYNILTPVILYNLICLVFVFTTILNTYVIFHNDVYNKKDISLSIIVCYLIVMLISLLLSLLLCIITWLIYLNIFVFSLNICVILSFIVYLFILLYLCVCIWIYVFIEKEYFPKEVPIIQTNDYDQNLMHHCSLYSARKYILFFLLSTHFALAFGAVTLFFIYPSVVTNLITHSLTSLPGIFLSMVFKIECDIANLIMYLPFFLFVLCLVLSSVISYEYFNEII